MIAARTEQSGIKSNFRVKSILVLPWESEKELKLVQVALTVKGLKDEMPMAGNEKEESWLTLEVRAIWQWQLSLHSLPRSIHLITK